MRDELYEKEQRERRWFQMAHELGVQMSDDMIHAMRYLDAIGQRFLVHFGFDNVLTKAHDLWRQQGIN